MTVLNVLLGSPRTKSNGQALLNYLKTQQTSLEADYQITLRFINLHDFPLPPFNGPLPPMADPHRQVEGLAKEWLATLKAGDGFLILEPVYNNSLPGAFKNAIDYVAYELAGKPVRIVSYSTARTGGIMAGYALMPILAELGAVVLPTVDVIGQIDQSFSTDGGAGADENGYAHFTKVLVNAVADLAKMTKQLN